ncbi:MAG: glycosyltransferase family 1 protein [Gemmatimonadaceae bacterium]
MRCYTRGPTENSWQRPPLLQHVSLPSRLSPILWENSVLRRAARQDDVLFGASYTIPLKFSGRSVVGIHGIYEGPNAEPTPWWYRYRFSAMYKASAHHADMVLANSTSTRDEIVEYYGVDPAKIRVIYWGVGDPFGWRADRDAIKQDAARALGFAEPYFVFVGNLSPRRHVGELLRAFAEARPALQRGTRLVIIGPNKTDFPLDEHIRKNGLSDHVTYMTHIDQQSLAAVYGASLSFILPTTHEGLSATILEAMACGAPVLTVEHATLHEEGFAEASFVLALPEVGLLRDAIVKLATDQALRERLKDSSLACAGRLTWRQTSERTIQALWEVATR